MKDFPWTCIIRSSALKCQPGAGVIEPSNRCYRMAWLMAACLLAIVVTIGCVPTRSVSDSGLPGGSLTATPPDTVLGQDDKAFMARTSQYVLVWTDYGRAVSLAIATLNGYPESVRFLIGKGADPNCRGPLGPGKAALHGAAEGGSAEVATILLDYGVDVNATDDAGSTPLHEAAFNGHLAVAEILLNRGAKLDARDSTGNTPLCWAAAEGHKDLVRLLLAHGANPNVRNVDGRTPLLMATDLFERDPAERAAIIKMLLKEGANPGIASKTGETLLKWAAAGKKGEVIALLQASEARE
jgi:ankyrin repeat protein